MVVGMTEAKTRLSKLVQASLRGERVVIANRGKPVVELALIARPPDKPVGGCSTGAAAWPNTSTN
jgi:antitoxin (DNA-binding transcriptional repressor) of toxin-antitoxin stability system